MKTRNQSLFSELRRVVLAGICMAAVACPQTLLACSGSRPLPCVVNPAACLKSMVLAKAVPTVVVFPPGGPATFNVPMNLFMTCPLTNNCGNVCPNPGGPVSASLTVNLYPGPPCPPAAPLPPPTVTSTISTAAGTMALPLCTPGGAFNAYMVPVVAPAGTPLGLYCVVGTATVTFAGGQVLTQTGDTVICLVEEAPDVAGQPRLDLELITPEFPRMAPGDQTVARYRITNNDRDESVQLNVFATSRQAAVRPQGGNEEDGVFAISNPFGDDFPIQFNPGTDCIPLPPHPYIQPEIRLPLPLLGPGQSTNVSVGIRSYGQCADGSCSETTLRVEGIFSDGSPALACAGMAFYADTSMPSQNCGREVNDCNGNGIPDALDIASRHSADQNMNAMPDECEEIITIPVTASVNPQVVRPGDPLQVQVAFNEVLPLQQVWANGTSLVRTQFFGAPLWVGTIPADPRPGPQTVYFLGQDEIGGLATFGATYQVIPPPAPVFAHGLAHQPLGQAQVALNRNGNLVVSNIGSSGQDGVSIDVGQTPGFHEFELLADPPLPGFEIAILGQKDGTPGLLGTLTGRPAQGQVQITPDFSPVGATTSSVQLFLNGELVFSQSGLTGPGCRFPLPPRWGGSFGPGWFFPDKICDEIRFPDGPVPVTIPGGPTILADRLLLEPDDPTASVDFVSQVELRSANVPMFTLVDEAIGIFDPTPLPLSGPPLRHHSLGQARLEPRGDHLTISNIGSSGEDGVSIDLGNLGSSGEDGFMVGLEPVDLSTPGAGIFVQTTGIFNGVPNTFLGQAGCMNNNGQVQATADYSAIGSSNVRLEIYDGDTLVGTAVVPGGGPVALVNPGPTGPPRIVGCGKLPPFPPCYIIDLDRLGTFVPLSLTGEPLVGNQVRLLADNAQGAINGLQQFDISGADLGRFTILDEFEPTPSPIHAFGLQNGPVGQAQVALNRNGQLVVSNIGSSGQDGVRIELGESDGLHWDMLFADPLPQGGMTILTHSMGATGERLASRTTLRPVGDDLHMTPDLSLGQASTYGIQLYLDGQLVLEQSGLDRAQSVIVQGGAAVAAIKPCYHVNDNWVCSFRFGIKRAFTTTLPGPDPVIADTLVITPEDSQVQFDNMSAVELLVAEPEPQPWRFLIAREWLMMFRDPPVMAQPHLAQGEARFDARGGRLTVSNIGSSGLDGVSVDFEELGQIFGLAPVRGFHVDLAPLQLDISNGLRVSATGVFNGQPNTFLGSASLRNRDGAHELLADYSAIGASRVEVQVLDNGSVVGSAQVPVPASGVVGRLTAGPIGLPPLDGCGKIPPYVPPLPCFILNWGGLGRFNFNDGTTLMGDEVRILAADATGPIDRLSTFNIAATDVGQVTLMGETLLPPFVGFEYTHTYTINGQTATARASGPISLTDGSFIANAIIDPYIAGYRRWWASPVTLTISSVAPALAQELAGARNLLSLTGGQLGYSARVTTQDRFADITTDIQVEARRGTIVATLTSQGTANYPELVGMEGPTVFRTLAGSPTELGYTEVGVKRLVTESGEVINSVLTAEYSGLAHPLPGPQVREINLEVLSESADFRNVSYRVQNTVRPQTTLDAFGLTHHAAGQASVALNRNGQLVVSNIGSSGQDGVRIDLGESEGLHWVTTLPNGEPEGAEMTIETRGMVDGNETLLGTTVVQSRNGDLHLRPVSQFASSYELKLLLKGEVVLRLPGVSTAPVIVQGGATLSQKEYCYHWGSPYICSWHFVAPTPVDPNVPGGPGPVIADTLVMTPEDGTLTPDSVTQIAILGRGLPPLVISDEWLMMFGKPDRMAQPHRVLGDGRLQARGDHLTISNIGSSGEDGVSVDFDALGPMFGLPDVRGYRATLQPLPIPRGDQFEVSATGTFRDTPNAFLGRAGLRNFSGEAEVFADFSPIGASMIQVEVYDGGRRVGGATVPGGDVVATLTAGPSGLPPLGGCGKLPPWPLPCYILELIGRGQFNLTDGTSLVGDEIRLLAADARGQISRLSSLNMRAITVTAFAISGEEIIPPVVITDFTPRTGEVGTVLTIRGHGFGNDPDDLCIVLDRGGRFIDLEAVSVTDTQITARIWYVPPASSGRPHEVMVGVGDGQRRAIECPQFPDVVVGEHNWVWRGDADQMAVAPGGAFVPVAAVPAGAGLAGLAPGSGNFHSGPPSGGVLTVRLDRDWGLGTRFCISARVHAQGTGADTRIGPVEFTLAGSRRACAQRICDLLIQAFAAHSSRPLNINCTVTVTTGGDAVITVSLPNGVPIDGGNIDIILKPPPPIIAGIWDIKSGGIWRKEVRKREIARWYRHYEWTLDQRLWLHRRAEGVWIKRQAIRTFTCRTHCILRNPNGPGVWRIWRTFTRTDVQRFRHHYRIWWVGLLNPAIAPLGDEVPRMALALDHVEVVLPMEPQDPNPATPFNEAVMVFDETGRQHFLGQPGFEVMPDTAMNPNGFQLATTAQSTDLLPRAADRIRETDDPMPPGMATIAPGVEVEWLMDDQGNVLVDRDNNDWPDRVAVVMGNQKHQGLIDPATGIDGNELVINQDDNPLQLYCWLLDENGEVLGARPGQAIIGPPVDLDADGRVDNALGAPLPMDPTVNELVELPDGGVVEQRDPTAHPVELALVEEPEPTALELQQFNDNIAAQLPNFVPLRPPFSLCIRQFKAKRIWGIDRRVVMDTWFHHWEWKLRHHLTFQRGAYRVWITKLAVAQFRSRHHHYVVGQPPTWWSFNRTHLRFFRVCYRIFIPQPNVVRVKIDEIQMVVPENPNDPNSPLMMVSTEANQNRLPPPDVLAGLATDPLPFDEQGVFIEELDPVRDTLDMSAGGVGVFETRPAEFRGMRDAVLLGNEDLPNQLNNNQLQLYCWLLDGQGNVRTETFDLGGGPGFAAGAGGSTGTITLSTGPTPAIPVFEDESGQTMDNPTMFSTEVNSLDNTVRIARNNGNVTLSWDGPGVLQSADEVEGPYTDEPNGALSPVMLRADQMKQFYRVRR